MNTVKIGFMGVFGSFSDKATIEFTRKLSLTNTTVVRVPLVDAFHVRDALLEKEIDLGVIAVRNSTTGTVVESAEAFLGLQHEILLEYALPVHQCIFKLRYVPLEQLKDVASHPQALMQTRKTRQHMFPEMNEVIMEDTSLSAVMLADGRLPQNTAVICSLEAGLMNGLELIGENIEDNPDNKTFFHLIRL